MKRFILTEDEKKDILSMYMSKRIVSEQEVGSTASTPSNTATTQSNSTTTMNELMGMKLGPLTKNKQEVTNAKELFGIDKGTVELIHDRRYPGYFYIKFINIPTTLRTKPDQFVAYTKYFKTENTTAIDHIKDVVEKLKNGNITDSELNQNSKYLKTFFDFYKNNNLNGYSESFIFDVDFQNWGIDLTIRFNGDNFKSIWFTSSKDGGSIEYWDGYKWSKNVKFTLDGNTITFTERKAKTPATETSKLEDISENDLYLKKGSKGVGVMELKRSLIISDKIGDIQITSDMSGCQSDTNKCDNVFDDATDSAVREFQKSSELKVDGIVGPNTAWVLKSYLPKDNPVTDYSPSSTTNQTTTQQTDQQNNSPSVY